MQELSRESQRRRLFLGYERWLRGMDPTSDGIICLVLYENWQRVERVSREFLGLPQHVTSQTTIWPLLLLFSWLSPSQEVSAQHQPASLANRLTHKRRFAFYIEPNIQKTSIQPNMLESQFIDSMGSIRARMVIVHLI